MSEGRKPNKAPNEILYETFKLFYTFACNYVYNNNSNTILAPQNEILYEMLKLFCISHVIMSVTITVILLPRYEDSKGGTFTTNWYNRTTMTTMLVEVSLKMWHISSRSSQEGI